MNGHPQFEEDFDLHALGAVEAEEKQALEAHLAACSACARKADDARGRLAVLALAAPAEVPPARVKERLLGRVRAEAGQRSALPFTTSPRWLAPALALASVILGVALVSFWQENGRLASRVRELQSTLARQTAEAARARTILEVLTSPESIQVTLISGPARPVPAGKAFYHPRKGLVFYATNLPAQPRDRTYQLWLVPVKGNPVNAGVFQPDALGNGSVLLPALPPGLQAKAFAVTVEPAGGVPQPTGPKVLVGLVS